MGCVTSKQLQAIDKENEVAEKINKPEKAVEKEKAAEKETQPVKAAEKDTEAAEKETEAEKAAEKETEPENNQTKQEVTPFKVAAAKGNNNIDYDKLIDQFGCQRLNSDDISHRVQTLTNRPAHRFLSRGIFFAHRDFDKILDAYELGQKFYLYTGRGPSSESLHLGHLMPFMFTKYLQDAFKVPLVIQLSDDEKTLFKDISVEESKRFARENAKDIIACGFDISNTFIFQNTEYVSKELYENIIRIGCCASMNKVNSIFGFVGEDHFGKMNIPAVQAAPAFPTSFKHLFGDDENVLCLIPCAIDQDPFFRLARDVAPRLKYNKPALIESKFFPALQGESHKMSASDENSAIYLTDSREDIRKKVNKYAFSGGRDSIEEHREEGANLSVDIPYKYLSFFLEDDDELKHILKEYDSGRMLTGEVKKRLIDVLTQLVETHRAARAKVTEEMVDAFMAVRPLPNMYAS